MWKLFEIQSLVSIPKVLWIQLPYPFFCCQQLLLYYSCGVGPLAAETVWSLEPKSFAVGSCKRNCWFMLYAPAIGRHLWRQGCGNAAFKETDCICCAMVYFVGLLQELQYLSNKGDVISCNHFRSHVLYALQKYQELSYWLPLRWK